MVTNLLSMIDILKLTCMVFLLFIRNFLEQNIIDEITGEQIGEKR